MADKQLKITKQPGFSKQSAPLYDPMSLPFVVGVTFVLVLMLLKFRPKKWRFRKPKSYINANGYVVLAQENELEHRHIAKQLLGRNLESNEVVHHINGRKTDNQLRNLCLMDREKHELFHTWLRWKKEKSGRYPSFYDQNRVLVDEFGGTLLKYVKPVAQEKKSELKERLFDELRKERKRLADEEGVPAYVVFDDKTLKAIADTMPESESLMLKINGVGTEKFRLYGAHFINVVKKFKNAG